jgi:hypothetical protein
MDEGGRFFGEKCVCSFREVLKMVGICWMCVLMVENERCVSKIIRGVQKWWGMVKNGSRVAGMSDAGLGPF